ncbi:exophilin-5 isoform X2 [Paroedura picta]|uniref:exophilin-5 isoform X2 n=1 Tax=Paroedura picta TaxID=143630 RepID=UPI0040565659
MSIAVGHLCAALSTYGKGHHPQNTQTETHNPPLATKLTNKQFDGTQAEATEDTATWNEQLEKELLRVLGSLDEQLAHEQAQGPAKRRATTDYGCRTSDANQYPTVTRQSFQKGIQRNERSMFLPDGARTLRAREEHPTFFRPRTVYDTYLKKYHVEDYANQKVLDRRSPVPKRWFSTRSLGHSSEGSMEQLAGLHGSGFQRRDLPCTNTVSRSYSLSSLSRRQSSGSVDLLSSEGPQHPLAAEGNRAFTQRNFRHRSKRTPLSSVLWNAPHSSECLLDQDRILRTQSLMDFGPKFEETYPCSPWDNTKYEFYRSNLNRRRAVPNASPSSRVGYPDKFTDPIYFENWENLHQPERNITSPPYRCSSLRGRTHLFHKRFPSGRMEEELLEPDSNRNYNDDPFLTCDPNSERFPTNHNDWQSACARKISLRQRESDAQNNMPERMRSTDHLDKENTEEFLRRTKGVESRPMYTSTAPLPFIKARPSNQPGLSESKGPAKYAAQRHSLFTRGGQLLMKPLVARTPTKEDFQTTASEDLRDTGQSSRSDNGGLEEGPLGPVSGKVDPHHPTDCPSKNSSAAVPKTPTYFKPPVSLNLNLQAKSASSRDVGKMYLSSTQHRNRPHKENDCALNSDLDQTSPPWLTGNRTRDSDFQSLQRGRHHCESVRVSRHTKQHGNIGSSGVGTAWKGSGHDGLSDPCIEKSNKCSGFVRYASSNSMTGSPSSSPPQSPVTHFTIPRKSASIDGSFISQRLLSSPKRRVPFENQAAMEDNLEAFLSNRNESSQNQRHPVAFANLPHSSFLKDVADKGNVPQTEDHHPDSPLSATDKNVRKSEKSTITCRLDRTETTVLTDCEEKDGGNPLQKCKTTSMVTVSVDEDNIKYHELISVYYTLPRKHSRKLCNLFLDDSSNVGSSPPSGQSPSKKCVHTGLEAAGFPCNSEKANLPTNTSATPGMSHDSKIPDEANKEGPHLSSPMTDLLRNSTVMGSNRKEAPEQGMRIQPLIGNRPLSLSTSNLHLPLSTRNAQKENPSGCQPPEESAVSNNPHLSCSMNSEKRGCASDAATDAPVSSIEEKTRREAKVKERARHICHVLALHSKKGNGLQPRNESVPSGMGETLASDAIVQTRPANQTLQVEAAAVDNPSLQPHTPATCLVKPPKPRPEQMLQNNPVYPDGTSSEVSASNSGDHQNPNSEDQLPNATPDLADRSTTENNPTLDNTQEKASELEKRKNRPSFKNKLAAMCKTNRRFSSKKSVNLKPHISSVFSYNDPPSSEISKPLLISSVVPQSLLQPGNENQNQNPMPEEFENKKSQTHEGSPLVTNENRRPFTNLCNQKRETESSRHSVKRVESNVPNPAGSCQKDGESTLNNPPTHEAQENSNCPTVSLVTAGDLSQKKKDATTIESPLFSPSFDKSLNNLTKKNSKVNISPQQKALSPTEYGHYQNVKQANRLKSPNLPLARPSPSKPQRERHFSESSYTREPHKSLAPKSSLICHNSRRFNSYSELLSCNEDENWEDPNRTFGSRHLMYPSVEFGIFGKEQQQAFLDNIKRSLTEGRLWRPCLLKNPSFLRKEEDCSVTKSEVLGSGFPKGNESREGSSKRRPVEAGPVDNSDSDSDTTTDDEYYPNEHDKESEL